MSLSVEMADIIMPTLNLLMTSDYESMTFDYDSELMTSDNTSTEMPLIPPTRTEMTFVKTAVLSAIFLLSFIGNVATLVQLYRMRRRKSTINLLIFHLATADLLVTCFCDVTEAVWASTVQWYAGNAACKLLKFMQVKITYLLNDKSGIGKKTVW